MLMEMRKSPFNMQASSAPFNAMHYRYLMQALSAV